LSTFELSYRTELPAGTEDVIAPGGMATPHGSTTAFQVEGGTAIEIQEANTGQTAYRIAPTDGALRLTWCFDDAVTAPYPEAMFTPRDTPFTRSAADLVAEAQVDAGALQGPDRAQGRDEIGVDVDARAFGQTASQSRNMVKPIVEACCWVAVGKAFGCCARNGAGAVEPLQRASVDLCL
ncbi:MAG: hypothetical protein AAGK77_15935, partial [Pseudomonadota bacterium]